MTSDMTSMMIVELRDLLGMDNPGADFKEQDDMILRLAELIHADRVLRAHESETKG
jgi:hypothetical protein